MNKTKAEVKIKNKLDDAFTFNIEVRQEDGLSAVLFNLILYYVIQKVEQKRTIFSKSSQICAYADDIVILARCEKELKEKYREIEETDKLNS